MTVQTPTRVPLPADFLRLPVAHRALHDRAAGRPENSRDAVRAAVAAGYAIEIDVQRSSDGQAMVFHDDDLDRLTLESGPLRARTAADLGAIRLTDAADGIPTLPEVLALVGGRVPLLIEVKDQTGDLSAGVGPLERAVATALAGYAGPVALMSFNPHSVAALAELAPDVPRGLTTMTFDAQEWGLTPARAAELSAIPDYDRTGASFVSHHWKHLDDPRIADLAAHGAGILCWTVRAPDIEATARRIAHNVTFEGYPAPIPAA
ncbi:MAG: phosphodiesterase [Rhodobacteraceae bacterium]|jgi:glycerophosphoryl diester phosphodiesterase|nr:phosphodiesterase [Paracoccaceae bacterium]